MSQGMGRKKKNFFLPYKSKISLFLNVILAPDSKENALFLLLP